MHAYINPCIVTRVYDVCVYTCVTTYTMLLCYYCDYVIITTQKDQPVFIKPGKNTKPPPVINKNTKSRKIKGGLERMIQSSLP